LGLKSGEPPDRGRFEDGVSSLLCRVFKVASKREAARSASAIKACKARILLSNWAFSSRAVSCISTSHWAVLGMASKCRWDAVGGVVGDDVGGVVGMAVELPSQPGRAARGHLDSSRLCRLKYRLVRINKMNDMPNTTTIKINAVGEPI